MIWLGLTMECAQCHDHKYDPISQEDYYRFYAFFNQTPEKGMQTRNGNAEPRVMVPSDTQVSRIAYFDAEVKRHEDAFANATPATSDVSDWIAARRKRSAEPQFDTWHRIGPFKGRNLDAAFGKKFGPEKRDFEVDKKFGKLRWKKETDWKDGSVIRFEYADAGDTTYLHRTIVVDEPMELSLSLGSDDAIAVWVNRKEVHKNKTTRGAAADQDKVDVSLKAGTNHLLMKICNGTGETGFYFKAGDSRLPEKVQEAIEVAEDKRTSAQTNLVVEHFKSKVLGARKGYARRGCVGEEGERRLQEVDPNRDGHEGHGETENDLHSGSGELRKSQQGSCGESKYAEFPA